MIPAVPHRASVLAGTLWAPCRMPLVCVPLKGVRLSHLSKSYPAFFRVASRAAFFPYLWAAPERGQGGFHHFRASSGAEQREFARGRGHHPPPPSEVRWAGGLRSGTPEQLPPHRRVWIQNASNVLDCQSAWTLPSYTVHLLQNLTCFDDSPGTLAQLPKSLWIYINGGTQHLCQESRGQWPAGYLFVTCLSTPVGAGEKPDNQLLHPCMEKIACLSPFLYSG